MHHEDHFHVFNSQTTSLKNQQPREHRSILQLRSLACGVGSVQGNEADWELRGLATILTWLVHTKASKVWYFNTLPTYNPCSMLTTKKDNVKALWVNKDSPLCREWAYKTTGFLLWVWLQHKQMKPFSSPLSVWHTNTHNVQTVSEHKSHCTWNSFDASDKNLV